MNKVFRIIKDKKYRFFVMNRIGITHLMSDKRYLKAMYFYKMGKYLDLENPQTFNEKLQWLKLYDRKPEYTTMVDKFAAKKYVANIIGEKYTIPTQGVWDRFDDIDFDKLPNQFVLKCTHDSGGLVICKDKSEFNKESARKKINRSLSNNYYFAGREYPYKNVPHRIIAEEFIDENGHVPTDYKVYCFNGVPYKVMLCIDRDKPGATKFYSFDKNWDLLRHNKMGKEAPEDFTLPKPHNFEKMFEFASILSKNTTFLRVDFYEVNRKLYFGELTFYPDSGFDNAILPETDQLYGSMIMLPLNNKIR